VVGCTTGSRGEVPGERKPAIRDDQDDNDIMIIIIVIIARTGIAQLVVGIATGYGLDDRMIGVRFPPGAGNFSLRHRVQTGSGAHPTSYQWVPGLFPWG
jgi:hypothetical protein